MNKIVTLQQSVMAEDEKFAAAIRDRYQLAARPVTTITAADTSTAMQTGETVWA